MVVSKNKCRSNKKTITPKPLRYVKLKMKYLDVDELLKSMMITTTLPSVALTSHRNEQ